jgi:hypothetical protein
MAKHTKVTQGRASGGSPHVPAHGGPVTGNGVGFTKRLITIIFKGKDEK